MAVDTGIEHYYPLASDYADDVGSDDMYKILSGGAFVSGKLGNAFDNESTCYLRQSSSGAGDWSMSGDPEDGLTFDCWFNLQAAGSGAQFVCEIKPGSGDTAPGTFHLFWDPYYLRFTAGVYNNGFTIDYVHSTPYDSAPTGQWVYLCGWYDLTYVGLRVDDAESTATHSGLTGATGTWPYFYLLADNNGSSKPDAIIDDVAVWNRTLSQSDRDTRYNGGNGLAYPFPTPGKPNILIW